MESSKNGTACPENAITFKLAKGRRYVKWIFEGKANDSSESGLRSCEP
jgi:hypothetical protein